MKDFLFLSCLCLTLTCVSGCTDPAELPAPSGAPIPPLTLSGVAQLFSELPLSLDQVREVRDAVTSSMAHGYDEEYLMSDLFAAPGTGVGESGEAPTRASAYAHPLRDLLRERLTERVRTRSGGDGTEADVEAFLGSLAASGMQIYWPYARSWDGVTMPLITFDPETAAQANIGYEIQLSADGEASVRRYPGEVTEETARRRPVWVINANDDSGYLSLEQLRRRDPSWGQGGRIVVGGASPTRSGGDFRTLILKDFKMKQHYDSWFQGASEFWVKCGSVQGFNASTEAEMRLFQPTVTDFMISVKREQLDQTLPFDAVIISEWTDQLDSFAFLVTEDDGGTRTSWKVDATVKVQSKSYGFTLDIPYNQRDDIVWRGILTSRYFEKYNGELVHFGGVDATFELR